MVALADGEFVILQCDFKGLYIDSGVGMTVALYITVRG